MIINIAVLDYRSCTVKMYSPELRDEIQYENVEDWLYNNTDYNSNVCEFMFSEKEIKVECL